MSIRQDLGIESPLPKASNGMDIAFNFFDFMTVLLNRNMHAYGKKSSFVYAYELSKRHTPKGKKIDTTSYRRKL